MSKLTNKVMITLSGVICIGFILFGILGILDYLIIQIVLGGLFLFFIIGLFYVNLGSVKNNSDRKDIDKEKASTTK